MEDRVLLALFCLMLSVLALPVMFVLGRAAGLKLAPLQTALNAVHRGIDALNNAVGNTVAWFTLGMVLIQTVVVIQRYVFGIGSILLQESIMYLHGLVFLLASGYTLLHNGHVRVDVFYRNAKRTSKALIDFLGCYVFLFPVMLVVIEVTLPYVQLAWIVREGSTETSGIQGVYLLKTAILVFAGLLLLQGLSMAIHTAFALTGVTKGPDEEEHLTF